MTGGLGDTATGRHGDAVIFPVSPRLPVSVSFRCLMLLDQLAELAPGDELYLVFLE